MRKSTIGWRNYDGLKRNTRCGECKMNIEQIFNLARVVQRSADSYSREMEIDAAFLDALQNGHGPSTRQYRQYRRNLTRPKRIDFRLGGPNPVLIELAVRPRDGASELYGSQNTPELDKLLRYPQSRAKLRALVLMDFAPVPIEENRMRSTYDVLGSGPGRFERNSVRIMYLHRTLEYHFLWRG
jgi:hypothetical protein